LVLPRIERRGAVRAWIIEDTGFPKKGKHSVGVVRQNFGQLGKQDNCQVAVNIRALTALRYQVVGLWRRWLLRRSQRTTLRGTGSRS
jgi:SRSO17 transposase